ncbi:MAG: Rieske 2Fe-2S domain-containing protein [Steroidobacteraceae bacterium]
MIESGTGTAPHEGCAYGRQRPHTETCLTEVGPGTPMGELMRRYWHPIALSARLKELPRKVRVLGEDLVLFRDRVGRPGLLYPRCMHRGASLYYGRTEERGIRCCYHGWLYDVEGRCLEQPCEPGGGCQRETIRQPWYPVEERYGFVFAYLGPPGKKPILPRYDNMEDMNPAEALANSLGGFGATADMSLSVLPYSWLNMNDNIMDPFHVHVLHTTFSVVQFVHQYALMPRVDFFETENGVCYAAVRRLDNGREVERISSWLMPNVASVPDITMQSGRSIAVSWIVPVDDTHHVYAMAIRVPRKMLDQTKARGLVMNGKTWGDMTEEEHQSMPGDYEAQAGQGPVSLHSEEHLVTSDRGLMMQRRMLMRGIEVVARGGDPAGVTFDPANALVHVRSGNFYRRVGPASDARTPADRRGGSNGRSADDVSAGSI